MHTTFKIGFWKLQIEAACLKTNKLMYFSSFHFSFFSLPFVGLEGGEMCDVGKEMSGEKVPFSLAFN